MKNEVETEFGFELEIETHR
ncbi:hypothetical protein KAOT1_19187 [Kordia algicida OT-1]|uniref:Uncharacterized protein n=1 Tax=Kordia algicida OT-1 TaxID=391587 RepID=A9DNZ2_9FLAO|nr:hypothetical protein KAOT1_19187 [Kordia algicida OT-1]